MCHLSAWTVPARYLTSRWSGRLRAARSGAAQRHVSHMKRLVAAFLLLLVGGAAMANPTCANVAQVLFGFPIGHADPNALTLRAGLRQEGIAHLIPDVGFVTIEGTVDSVRYPRIMAFFYGNTVDSVRAIGRREKDRDYGLSGIVDLVAKASNSNPERTADGVTFDCEGAVTLEVTSIAWDDGAAVSITIQDKTWASEARQHLKEYCADPKRRRPQDACRK